MLNYLVAIILIVIPLYPKFPLVGVSGTFVSIRIEDLILAAVYIIWGIYAVKNKLWLAITKTQRATLIFWLIGFVSVFSGIFLTKTVTPALGVLHFLRRIEYMGLIFVAYSALKDLRQLRFLVNTLLIVSAIVALFGLGQQFLGFPVISTNNSEFSKGLALSLGPGARINSTFAGHYDLAAFSVFPILLVIGLLMLPKTNKPILIFLGVISYWAMLLSASRVTFVALLMSAGLMVILMRRPKWLVAIFIAGVVGLLISSQLLGRYRELIVNNLPISVVSTVHAADDDVPDALKPAAVAEDRSLNIRLNASWPRATRSLLKNPILGTGFSSIGLAADNDYLRALAETGLLGTLAFGLVFIRVFQSLKTVALHPKPELRDVFIVTIGCSLIALLLNAVFIDIFEASKIAIITWTLVGLAEKSTKLS